MHTPLLGVVSLLPPSWRRLVTLNKHSIRFFFLTRGGVTGHRTNSVEVISEQFAGKSMVARHRLVYATLDGEMVDGGIHALALKTKTPTEIKASATNP